VRRCTAAAFKVLRPHYGNMASSCYYNAHKHGLSPSPFGEYSEPPVPFSLSLARRVFALLLVHAGINDVVKQTPAVFLLSRLHGETTSKTSCVAAQSTADLFRKYGARISAPLQLY
jgi:hypothetical protein